MIWQLFFDDVRNPAEIYKFNPWEFRIARDCTEAIEMIEAYGCPEFISFDHDIGFDAFRGIKDTRTGYDLAHWLVYKDLDSKGKFFPATGFSFNVHSANPVGAENIRKLLDSYMEFRAQELCRDSCKT